MTCENNLDTVKDNEKPIPVHKKDQNDVIGIKGILWLYDSVTLSQQKIDEATKKLILVDSQTVLSCHSE